MSVLGSRATAADALLTDSGGCQVPACPRAIMAADKRALTKEWRALDPIEAT